MGKKSKRAKPGTSKEAAAIRKDLFVEAYITNGGNATQSAIAAGYSEKTAHSIGSRMLKDVKVAPEIRRRQEEIQAKTGLTTERILQELSKIVFADVRKLFDENGALLPPEKWPDDVAAAVAGVDVVEMAGNQSDEFAPSSVPMFTKKVKTWDKNAAIEKAMKHLGLFARDKDPTLPPSPVNVKVSVGIKPDEAYLRMLGKK